MNTNPYKKVAADSYPIATLHYTETTYSLSYPKRALEVKPWKRDFWTREEIQDYFKHNPERPFSYIKRVPRKVTWHVSGGEATCDGCNTWDAAKRVLDMLAKR